jgi:hypothetical protein
MSVTRSSRTIILTAAGDNVVGPLAVASIKFVGTGLTPAQRLLIKHGSTAAGAVRCDHYVIGANEDAEIFHSDSESGDEWWNQGIYLDTVPAAGTWTVIVRLK